MPASDAPAGFQAMKGVVAIPSQTASAWTTQNPIVPAGVLAFETDTKRFKMGDGTTAWTALDYTIQESLTPEQKALLENAGLAGGALVLDGDGKVPMDSLPEIIKGSIVYTADIAGRDELTAAQRSGLVMVVDASADPTVDAGAALYGYDTDWIKISEYESLDPDLSEYFNIVTMTLDDINDGVNFVRLSVADKAKLDTIEENADVTDAENVRSAGAVMLDDMLFVYCDPADLSV